ncbi:helix-turn-helix domain-containing protein [Castellaniella caeni]|uniref:helix-turn-helix domain-containing protein n=1 Tax=Castellaniella caeni TaxID=266123 RepID=UPI0012EE604F|nr:helix-turn-helix domain-containing protein [Castellaniella caeni]
MDQRAVWVLAREDDAYQLHMRARGWRLNCFAQPEALRAALAPMAARQLAARMRPVAFILLADTGTNCRLAQFIRGLVPGALLVALARTHSSHEMTALLRVGVHWVLRYGDAPTLLAATVRALLVQRGALKVRADQIDGWALADLGWSLRHRDSASIRLSVSERALLLCLFEAPGHLASHACIAESVAQAWRDVPGRNPRTPRMRSVVHGLRKRMASHGLPELPIEPLHNFGYIWAVA